MGTDRKVLCSRDYFALLAARTGHAVQSDTSSREFDPRQANLELAHIINHKQPDAKLFLAMNDDRSLAASASSMPALLFPEDEEVGSAAMTSESEPRLDSCAESARTISSSSYSSSSTCEAVTVEELEKGADDNNPARGHSLPTTVMSLTGSVLEWYDFAVYGYFSDIIGQVFFPPSASHSTATVEAYVIFGVAFLMRPIGAIVVGRIADATSRRKALACSMALMAVSTLLLGVLPTYGQVGNWAYVLLLILRLLQGLSAGGNLCTSLTYTAENHLPQHRGLYAGIMLSSTFVGLLLGSAVSALLRAVLTRQQLLVWGWRIPFLAGFAAVISAWYMRSRGTDAHEQALDAKKKEQGEGSLASSRSGGTAARVVLPLPMADSPTLEAPKTALSSTVPSRGPIRDMFVRDNASAIVGALMMSVVSAFGLYFTFVWLATYMSELSPIVLPNAYVINSIHIVIATFIELPLAGFLSDRYGRKRVMTIGAVGVIVLAPLVMGWVSLGSAGIALASLVALGSFYSLYVSSLFAWFVDSFEPTIRSTASGTIYNTAQALVGGFAPTIATLLVASSSTSSSTSSRSPGYLVSGLAGLALVGLWLVAPRQPRCPPRDEPEYQPPRWSDLLPCRRRRRRADVK